DCPLVFTDMQEEEGIAKLLGKRLPTELEWERAAAYTDGRRYPFGNEFDEGRVTFMTRGTRSVYAHRNGASPEGVLDLSGNVWERLSTPDGEIDLTDPKQPKFAETGESMVLRGGSWCCISPGVLCGGFRDYSYNQGFRKGNSGFRVAGDLMRPE
ncbi:MAG TPA: SUMF1/EgtB/PvdO family nonheme iron enzyme, partial [Candidatus Sulfotelmatobacter sp.]|nr:SUMF1/EgtB/PvdO family nonheme iron enzyme [Candidatus Sulfotelmatobacter sp.]